MEIEDKELIRSEDEILAKLNNLTPSEILSIDKTKIINLIQNQLVSFTPISNILFREKFQWAIFKEINIKH